jgi:hypothetical protein
LKNKWIALTFAVSLTAWGQVASYLGPGVLSRGSGDIGSRSGQQVDLRFYFDVTGVYDTGIQPFAADAKGNLVQINGLYGIQADVGAYGTHRWKQSSLGLDYTGNFYHYVNNSFFDGSSHSLSLGYTHQKSRRVVYDVRVVAGESAIGFGTPGFYPGGGVVSDVVNTPTTVLFDNRMYYLQPSMDMTYIQTNRTSFVFGGEGYFVRRAATGLADLNGYNLHGSIRHRLSKTKTISVTYEHVHYDFPPAFGQSDINLGQASFSSSIGRRWTFSAGGGVYQTQVQGVQQVALNPVVAALLGIGFGQQTFYVQEFAPAANLSLTGHYRTSSISISGSQSISPGNGVYLTSQQTSGGIGYSYTGIRKWNFGVSAGYNKLSSVGQGIQDYANFSGGAGITYNVSGALHIIARADSRYQQIDVVGYNRTGYRASFGLGFSPGKIPLSLW